MKKNDSHSELSAVYVAPVLEVIEMESEGVIAVSGGGTPEYTPDPLPSNGAVRSYGTSDSDFEDMINDILTVGN